MERQWPCYRLMVEKDYTPTEIKKMTLDEVDLLNLALDSWQDARREASINASKQGGR